MWEVLVNEFERKLRKLLYLKSALNKDDKSKENIKNLEEKELGKIFEFLFTDEAFTKEVRNKVKTEMSWQFAKKELFRIIESIKESTLWDELIGENSVPALRENYLDAKSYRNDIMHAHNISYFTYKDARSLFQKINYQLDSEIGVVITAVEKQPIQSNTNSYNAALGAALTRANYQDMVSQLVTQMNALHADIVPAVSLLDEMKNMISDTSHFSKSAIDAIAKANQPFPELTKLLSTYESMTPVTISQETLDTLTKAIELYQNPMKESRECKNTDDENEENT